MNNNQNSNDNIGNRADENNINNIEFKTNVEPAQWGKVSNNNMMESIVDQQAPIKKELTFIEPHSGAKGNIEIIASIIHTEEYTIIQIQEQNKALETINQPSQLDKRNKDSLLKIIQHFWPDCMYIYIHAFYSSLRICLFACFFW